MNYSYYNDNNLLSDPEAVPTEQDPFCNCSENSIYNESYSHIVPGFFFRSRKMSRRPSSYEKKRLRYFYNTTGVVLSTGLIIEISACLLFYIIMFLGAFTLTPSLSLYYAVLSDATVKYSFRTIAAVISTASVFFAGCRFSEMSPSSLLKKNRSVKTSDVVFFFMTGLFITSLQNLINLAQIYLMHTGTLYGFTLEKNITQIVSAAIYICLIVPVTEGLMFRGIALKNLSRASQRFGIICSSLLCALASGRFSFMVTSFLMAVLFSRLTIKYNTVLPSILIHITVNLCTMIIAVYNTVFWKSDFLIFQMWTAITFVICGIFAFIFAVKNPLPSSNAEQKQRTLPLMFTSVFILILVVLYICAAFANLFAFMYL